VKIKLCGKKTWLLLGIELGPQSTSSKARGSGFDLQ